jgi:PadR family transcriptional regulator, regulatory protein PadR
MRRRAGTLVPLEVSVLEAAIELRGRGVPEVYGFQLAKTIRQSRGARRLTAYGTLYKALDRLALAGLLTSRWEDPQRAADEGRPRRRFYTVTLTGEAALAEALQHPEPTRLRRSAASVRT